MLKKILALSFILSLICSCKYERTEGCHLDNLNLKGNVTKIETIVQTSIPITEIILGSINPSQAVCVYDGNFVLDFDRHGNVSRHKGYGVDGQLLLDVKMNIPEDEMYLFPKLTSLNKDTVFDNVKIIHSSNIVHEISYYSKGQPILNQKIHLNSKGNIDYVCKEYVSLSIKNNLISDNHPSKKSRLQNKFGYNKNDDYLYRAVDTTFYKYLSFDSHGNWTKASISYKGILPKHNYNYVVFRQITYDGETTYSPLIKKLEKSESKDTSSSMSDFVDINLGYFGKISIPNYMSVQKQDFINQVINPNNNQTLPIFLSLYDKEDSYASLSTYQSYSEDNSAFLEITNAGLYSKEVDEVLKDIYTQQMSSGGIYMLKWLPYETLKISSRPTLKYSYYRYGSGSPIPVYCENYTILMKDNYTLSIIFSYQSNHRSKFHNDFSECINSIRFY